MAASSLKAPPLLSEDISYADWRCDLQVWEMLTELDAKKKGPALYLTLQGKPRECLRELTPARIGGDNGYELILQKLDAVYLEDINFRTFTAFKSFYEFRRSADMSMKEFVISYETLYHRLDEFNVRLPEGVQAFFVLTAANVDEESERLARVTCPQLTYQDMKNTLLKIFSDPSASSDDSKIPAVKTEPVFKVSHRGSFKGNYSRGQGRGGHHNSESRMNPTDSAGKVMQCFKCGSKYHFARYCDKKSDEHKVKSSESRKEKSSKDPVYITLLSN